MNFRVCGLVAIAAFFTAVAPGQPRAANLTTLYNFCSLPVCADGANPHATLLADAKGNLFGTAVDAGVGYGTVFEIAKTHDGYASTPLFWSASTAPTVRVHSPVSSPMPTATSSEQQLLAEQLMARRMRMEARVTAQCLRLPKPLVLLSAMPAPPPSCTTFAPRLIAPMVRNRRLA
jgi:hypothetical protein